MVDRLGREIRVGDAVRLYPTDREVVLDEIRILGREEPGVYCGFVTVVAPDDFDNETEIPAFAVAGGAACYDLEKAA